MTWPMKLRNIALIRNTSSNPAHKIHFGPHFKSDPSLTMHIRLAPRSRRIPTITKRSPNGERYTTFTCLQVLSTSPPCLSRARVSCLRGVEIASLPPSFRTCRCYWSFRCSSREKRPCNSSHSALTSSSVRSRFSLITTMVNWQFFAPPLTHARGQASDNMMPETIFKFFLLLPPERSRKNPKFIFQRSNCQ